MSVQRRGRRRYLLRPEADLHACMLLTLLLCNHLQNTTTTMTPTAHIQLLRRKIYRRASETTAAALRAFTVTINARSHRFDSLTGLNRTGSSIPFISVRRRERPCKNANRSQQPVFAIFCSCSKLVQFSLS